MTYASMCIGQLSIMLLLYYGSYTNQNSKILYESMLLARLLSSWSSECKEMTTYQTLSLDKEVLNHLSFLRYNFFTNSYYVLGDKT